MLRNAISAKCANGKPEGTESAKGRGVTLKGNRGNGDAEAPPPNVFEICLGDGAEISWVRVVDFLPHARDPLHSSVQERATERAANPSFHREGGLDQDVLERPRCRGGPRIIQHKVDVSWRDRDPSNRKGRASREPPSGARGDQAVGRRL